MQVFPDARARNARLGFALIYPDRNGRNVMRVVRGCFHMHLTWLREALAFCHLSVLANMPSLELSL